MLLHRCIFYEKGNVDCASSGYVVNTFASFDYCQCFQNYIDQDGLFSCQLLQTKELQCNGPRGKSGIADLKMSDPAADIEDPDGGPDETDIDDESFRSGDQASTRNNPSSLFYSLSSSF